MSIDTKAPPACQQGVPEKNTAAHILTPRPSQVNNTAATVFATTGHVNVWARATEDL